MAQAVAKPTIKRKIFNFLILAVIPKMINATAVEAMPMPKLAASLYVEKYRISEPPCKTCVSLPLPFMKELSAGVNPKFFCFHTQNAANNDNAPHKYKYLMRILGLDI